MRIKDTIKQVRGFTRTEQERAIHPILPLLISPRSPEPEACPGWSNVATVQGRLGQLSYHQLFVLPSCTHSIPSLKSLIHPSLHSINIY